MAEGTENLAGASYSLGWWIARLVNICEGGEWSAFCCPGAFVTGRVDHGSWSSQRENSSLAIRAGRIFEPHTLDIALASYDIARESCSATREHRKAAGLGRGLQAKDARPPPPPSNFGAHPSPSTARNVLPPRFPSLRSATSRFGAEGGGVQPSAAEPGPAKWRRAIPCVFECVWDSEYVPNQRGGPEIILVMTVPKFEGGCGSGYLTGS